jgi:hypothetical protein
MSVKLTPFIMFLIILGVLLISIIFSKYLAFPLNIYTQPSPPYPFEGFVAFNSTNPSGSSVTLTNYSSNPVNCVYDNVFYDPKTGNILEVSGSIEPEYTDSTGNIKLAGNVGDVGGNTITSVYVNSRMIANQPIQTSYTDGDFSAFSSVPFGLEAYDSFTYTTHLNMGSSDQYAVVYVPWNQDTYIHIIGVNGTYANKNIVSQYYNGSTGITNDYIVSYISNGIGLPSGVTQATVGVTPINLTSSSISPPRVANSNDINGLSLTSTDTIYYINSNVLYDTTNGVVVINKKYYNVANGSPITNLPTTFQTPNAKLNSWMVTDGACVLVMTTNYNTVIVVLTTNYKIATVARFSKKGNVIQQYETMTNATINASPPPSASFPPSAPSSAPSYPPATPGKDGPIPNPGSNVGYDYSSFMNTCGADISKWTTTCLHNFFMMSQDYNTPSKESDYILKTQIVPPVCPTCPNCPGTCGSGSGVCTNCGGQGGSGTQGNTVAVSGNTGSTGLTVGQGTTLVNGNLATNANTNTVGGAISTTALGAVAGAEDIVKTGVSGAGNLATNVVNSATGLVSGAGTGVKDLATGLGSGVKDLATGIGSGVKDLVSGANSLVRDAASGTINTVGGAYNKLTEKNDQENGKDFERGGYYNSYSVNSDSRGLPGQSNRDGSGPASYKGVPIDNYSYYGALPSKGSSEFMPVTADFSTFRK